MEWHVTPEYINNNWTEEEFLLMFQMRKERFELAQSKQPIKKTNTMPLDRLAARIVAAKAGKKFYEEA